MIQLPRSTRENRELTRQVGQTTGRKRQGSLRKPLSSLASPQLSLKLTAEGTVQWGVLLLSPGTSGGNEQYRCR